MQYRPFSFRALVIAISVHLFIFGMALVGMVEWTKKHRKPQESRIQLSIKNTVISNHTRLSQKPKPTSSFSASIEKPLLSKQTSSNTAIGQPPIEEPLLQDTPIIPTGKMGGLIKRHYGDLFYDLTPAEQEFIVNNLQKIRRINYQVGNVLLADKPQDKLLDRDNNYVEFYLHPDGTVSDITLVNERQGSVLDELIVETIENAYSHYPRPKQTTFIRLRSWIIQVQEDED